MECAVTWITLGVGLLAITSGCVMAWFRKAPKIWAVNLFGFLLVIWAGLTSTDLKDLALLSNRNLKVGLDTEGYARGNDPNLIALSRQSVTELALSGQDSPDPRMAEEIREDAHSQRDFIEYFGSLGYIPSPIVGAEMFHPGNVISYSDGNAILWAAESEAFPSLNIVSAPAVFPDFYLREQTNAPAGPKTSLHTLIRCATAMTEVAPMGLLLSNLTSVEKLFAKPPGELYVVQESITCNALKLVSVKESGKTGKSSSKLAIFKAQSPVVLAYRILHLSVKSNTPK
jgi:hypothetical protein